MKSTGEFDDPNTEMCHFLSPQRSGNHLHPKRSPYSRICVTHQGSFFARQNGDKVLTPGY